MADIQSNIRIDVDTSGALAAIRNLQSQISQFQTSMNRGTAAQAAAASKLSQQLVSGINATGKFAASIRTVQTSSEAFTGALEKNKLSMGEYFRYSAASTKTFGRFFTSELTTIEKTARERVKTLQTQYVKLGRDANGAMKSIAIRPLALDMNNLGTQTAMAAQKQQIMNQLLRQGSTNLLNFGKNTQWAGRQLMVGFTIPLTIFGGIAAKTFMDLEKQVINFKKVYGDLFTTDQQAEKALDDVKALAEGFTQYGVAVSETVGIAADAAAAGFGGNDLINQTSAAIKISVLGQLDQQKALETTISLQNSFKLSSEELADAINFLNAVENQTVVALDDITTAIPKVAPVIQALGGDVKDLAFFLSAMKEGGVNASEGANALKSSLGRLINPTKVAREMFNGFGIDLVNIVERNAGNLRQTVLDLGTALDTLDPLNRSRAIEQLFGKFQFARMSTLFENINRDGTQAARVLDLAAYSAADLARIADEELGVSAASAMNKFQGALERLKAALAPVGEIFLQIATPLLEFATKVIEGFNNLDEGVKRFVTGLTAVLGVVGPVALMTFGLLANGVANLIKGFLAVRSVFQKTGQQTRVLGEQTEYLTQQQLEEMAVAASLETAQNKVTQTFTSQTVAIQKLIAAYDKAIVKQRQFAGTGMATNIGKTGPAPQKFKTGTLAVPGSGRGDTVPALLEPGEAVIPRDQAQKYAGFLKSIMKDEVPGMFFGGMVSRMLARSRVATRMSGNTFSSSLRSGDLSYKSGFATGTGADFTDRLGRPMKQHQLMRRQAEKKLYGVPTGSNDPSMRPTYGSVAMSPLQRILAMVFGGRKGRQFASVTNPMASNLDQYGDISLIGKRSLNKRANVFAGDTLLKYSKNPAWLKGTAPMQGASPEQLKTAGFDAFNTPFGQNKLPGGGTSVNPQLPYIEAQTMGGFKYSEIDKIIARDPAMQKRLQAELATAGLNIPVRGPGFVSRLMQKMGVPGFKDGVFSVPGPKGAGDVVPAMLSPGESVIPTKQTQKYAALINSIISDNVPGFKTGRVVESQGSGGVAISPGGSQIPIGNKHTLRAVGELMQSLDEAEAAVDLAFESLAGRTDVSISEFRKAIADSAKKLGEPVPEAVKGASSSRKHSASDVGERRPHRQQIEEERGAEGLAEYEREEAAAKELRLELERINQEKIEAGQTPLFSESDMRDLTQIDRSHIVQVDKDAMGRSSFHSDLTKPELGARNRFSGIMQASPKKNQKMMKETMQEMGISQQEQNALMDKYTSGLALTEEEHDLQARVLKRVLKKLEENSKLRKQVSPAFEKSATATLAVAKVKDANPELKASKERDISAAEAKRDQLIADKEAKAADKKAKAAKTQEQTANKDKKTSNTEAKAAKIQESNAKKAAKASNRHSQAAINALLASEVLTDAASQQKIAAMQNFKLSNRRVTTNPATAAASLQQQIAKRDASGMGFLSVGQRAAQSQQGQGLLNSLSGLTGGIMQASFAFSSISMMTGGLSGDMNGLSEAVFGISNAMFMLSAILPMVIAGFKKLSASMAVNNATSIGELLKGIPGRVSGGFGKAKTAALGEGNKIISGGLRNSWNNLINVGGKLGGVLGKVVPMFLKFIPFLGAAITAFGAIKFIGDIQEQQKQKIEGMGNAAFAAGEKLNKIASVIGFTPTRDPNRSDQITGVEGLKAGGADRAEAIRDSDEFASLMEGEFKQDLENIKNASTADAERILNSLAIQQLALAPEGTDPARIQEFVAAIAAEAGKTNVDLSMVLSFDPFDEETFKKIDQDIKTLANTAKEEFGDVEIGRETTQSRQKQFSPTIPADVQAEAKLLASEFSSFSEQLVSGLKAGTLSASEFMSQMNLITNSVTDLGPAIAGVAFDKMFENIGLPDVAKDIENVESQALILQASLAGVGITDTQLEAIAAGEELDATGSDIQYTYQTLQAIMTEYERITGETAKSVEDLANEEQEKRQTISTKEIEDQITANEQMVELYPELVEQLGSEEAALAAVSDEKTRQLILDAKEIDAREGGNANYLAAIEGLNDLAASQENVNDMQAASNLQTYVADLREQNAVLSWLTSNGMSVAEAMKVIGDQTLYTAAATEHADGNFKEFQATLDEIKSLELPDVSGSTQKSPFQEAVDGLKEERKQLKDTTSAYSKLRAEGFGITEAFSAAQDPVLATAIASTKVGTSGWRRLVSLLKEVDTLARTNAVKQLVAEQQATNELNSAFADVATTLGQMGYELDEIKNIMSDPNLMQAFIDDLEDGALDSKLIRDYLNSIENDKEINIKINTSTAEGIENEFMDLYNQAMESFDVRRDRVEDDFEDRIKNAQDSIEATSDAIETIEENISDIETTIQEKQREIELDLSRPIEDFQEEIADLERSIELTYNRPIADLQEESSDIANDLALMDKEAEGINEKYDDQVKALEEVSSINEKIARQQQGQLDLADALSRGDIAAAARAAQQMRADEAAARQQETRDALEAARQAELDELRTQNGLTREEAEERQFEISQAIFNLEEQREEVQARIQGIQDQIYDLEQQREKKLREIRDLEDQVYTIQQEQLKPAQDRLKNQQDMLESIEDERDVRLEAIALEEEKWQDTKLAFDEAMQRGKDYVALLKEAAGLLGQLNTLKDVQAAGGPGGGDSTGGGSVSNASTSNTAKGRRISYSNIGGGMGQASTSAGKSNAVSLGAERTISSGETAFRAMRGESTSDVAARLGVDPSKVRLAESSSNQNKNYLNNNQLIYVSGLQTGGEVPPQASPNAPYAPFKKRGTDTVPAMLTPGEFVIRRSVVNRLGDNFFDELNSTGQVPTQYRASGGKIDNNVNKSFSKEEYDKRLSSVNSWSKKIDKYEKALENSKSAGEYAAHKEKLDKAYYFKDKNQKLAAEIAAKGIISKGSQNKNKRQVESGEALLIASGQPSSNTFVQPNRNQGSTSGQLPGTQTNDVTSGLIGGRTIQNNFIPGTSIKIPADASKSVPSDAYWADAQARQDKQERDRKYEQGGFQGFEAGFNSFMADFGQNEVVKAVGNAYSADNLGGQIFRGAVGAISVPAEIMGAVAKNIVSTPFALNPRNLGSTLMNSVAEGTVNAFSGVGNVENQQASMFEQAAEAAIANNFFGAAENEEMASLARIVGGVSNIAFDPLTYVGAGLIGKGLRGTAAASLASDVTSGITSSATSAGSRFATGARETMGNIVSDFNDVFKRNPASSVHNNRYTIDNARTGQVTNSIDPNRPFSVEYNRWQTDRKTDKRNLESVPITLDEIKNGANGASTGRLFLNEISKISNDSGIPLRNILENSRFADMPEVSNAQQRSLIRSLISDSKMGQRIASAGGGISLEKSKEALQPSLLYAINRQKDALFDSILKSDSATKNFPGVTGRILNQRADKIKKLNSSTIKFRPDELDIEEFGPTQSKKYEKFMDSIRTDPNNTRVVIAAQPDAARNILKTRSFQPEVGRLGREDKFLGQGRISKNAAPAYGALYNKDLVPLAEEFSTIASTFYGPIKMILPSSVVKRTRAFGGDSLNQEAAYTQSLKNIMRGDASEAKGLFTPDLEEGGYAEAQILGGLLKLPKKTRYTLNKLETKTFDKQDLTKAEYTREGLIGGGNLAGLVEKLVDFAGTDVELLKKFRFADMLDISDMGQMAEFKKIVKEVSEIEKTGKARVKSPEYAQFKELVEGYNPATSFFSKINPIRRAVGGSVPAQSSGSGKVGYFPMGGKVAYKAAGGMFKSINTDTVPAMLTPGEFVVRKYAVDKYGTDTLKSINNGTYNGESVYNYNLSVNVKSDANPDDIARVVMTKIKQVDSQRIRGNRF